MNWACVSDLPNRHSQVISTTHIFCFQMQSSHILRSMIFPSFILIFNLWSLRRMSFVLLSLVFPPIAQILLCLNHADACLQRAFCTANFEYIVILRVFWGGTSLWIARLLKSLTQFLIMLRNFLWDSNVSH